jgi:hypothetical protein
VASHDATADESAVYDEIERRRRAFLAALDNDTSPVQPPRVDAGGMLVEDETEDGEQTTEDREQETGVRGQETEERGQRSDDRGQETEEREHGRQDACPTARPLNRRELRARQRMLEKKLRMRKAK